MKSTIGVMECGRALIATVTYGTGNSESDREKGLVWSMRVVKELEDIALLQEGQSIGPELANHIHQFYNRLIDDLAEMGEGYDYRDCGYVVVLEKGDNVRDLSVVGLNKEDSGLIGSIAEWVDKLHLDGKGYYSGLVLHNDNFGVVFYTEIGCFDGEVDAWFEKWR